MIALMSKYRTKSIDKYSLKLFYSIICKLRGESGIRNCKNGLNIALLELNKLIKKNILKFVFSMLILDIKEPYEVRLKANNSSFSVCIFSQHLMNNIHFWVVWACAFRKKKLQMNIYV